MAEEVLEDEARATIDTENTQVAEKETAEVQAVEKDMRKKEEVNTIQKEAIVLAIHAVFLRKKRAKRTKEIGNNPPPLQNLIAQSPILNQNRNQNRKARIRIKRTTVEEMKRRSRMMNRRLSIRKACLSSDLEDFY